jgi:hypothetical protein
VTAGVFGSLKAKIATPGLSNNALRSSRPRDKQMRCEPAAV